MLVSLKKFVGAAAVASVFCVSLPAQQAQGQAQARQAQAQPAAGARRAKELERSCGVRSIRIDNQGSHARQEAGTSQPVE